MAALLNMLNMLNMRMAALLNMRVCGHLGWIWLFSCSNNPCNTLTTITPRFHTLQPIGLEKHGTCGSSAAADLAMQHLHQQ